MKEKKLYTIDEIAQICEACYRYTSKNNSIYPEEKAKYNGLVPKSVREAIRDLRNVILEFYSSQNESRKEVRNSDSFKRFEEFFKVYDN